MEIFKNFFLQDKGVMVLMGEGEAFFQSHTLRGEHDVILAMTALLHWAKDNNTEVKAAHWIEEAIEECTKKGDLRKVYTFSFHIC